MLKIASAVAATALTVGTVGFNAYHTLYVKMNQAQASERQAQANLAAVSTSAASVVSACGELQETLAKYSGASVGLGSQYLTRGATSPEPSLASAKVESP